MAEVIFVRFSTVKLLLLSSPCFTVWKKDTMCIPHWRGEELCSTSLEVQHLYTLFDILSAWEISLFSLIHSIIYTNVDPSTFILDYNSILFYFVVQLVSALAIERSFSFVSYVLLTYYIYCVINTPLCVFFI